MQARSSMLRYFTYKNWIIISIITIALSITINLKDMTYYDSKVSEIINYIMSTIFIITAIISFRSTVGLFTK